jgi:hypothetical protein
MPVDIDITPAVCAVCDGVPPVYLKTNWDNLKSHIFRRESELYNNALIACALVHAQKGSKTMGFKIFIAALSDKPSNGFDFEKDTPVTTAIWDKYWGLAMLRGVFWESPVGSSVKAVPYMRAIEIWKQIAGAEISFYRERLEIWLTR